MYDQHLKLGHLDKLESDGYESLIWKCEHIVALYFYVSLAQPPPGQNDLLNTIGY